MILRLRKQFVVMLRLICYFSIVLNIIDSIDNIIIDHYLIVNMNDPRGKTISYFLFQEHYMYI